MQGFEEALIHKERFLQITPARMIRLNAREREREREREDRKREREKERGGIIHYQIDSPRSQIKKSS